MQSTDLRLGLQLQRPLALTLALASLAACSDDGGGQATTDQTESSTLTETGETVTETGETGTTGETETGEEGTTGEMPACDGNDPEIANWLLNLDGSFPDDLPTDAEQSCAIVESGANVLRVACPDFSFGIEITATPAPALPGPTDTAIVRVHHEGGWLNWPDLWIDVEVPGLAHWSFQASSVLTPTQGSYVVPWSPQPSADSCGPFLIDNMFGPDNCGEQLGHAVIFDVDGAPVVGWHATHLELEVDGRAFEAWMGAAREYIAPPEFCDVAPYWYSLITRRELD